MCPILYSFRRCPYAIRARWAIKAAGASVILREVSLKNKPDAMLAISPKGTVPVLLLPDGQVMEQSLDIIIWATGSAWLSDAARELIKQNDEAFKQALDLYKYAERFPEFDASVYRARGELFLARLEALLLRHRFLMGAFVTPVDWAIAPFVRQFVAVDEAWFTGTSYGAVRQWLADLLASELFAKVMVRYPPWCEDDVDVIF
jgi:glutathione S-transferase